MNYGANMVKVTIESIHEKKKICFFRLNINFNFIQKTPHITMEKVVIGFAMARQRVVTMN